MQHEPNSLRFGSVLILENHSAVRVLCSLVCILATYKYKTHGPSVVHVRRCNSPAHTAAETLGIGEAVPIHTAGLESSSQHAAGPVGCRGNRSRGRGYHASEHL